MKLKRYIATFDIHNGLESAYVRNKLIIRRTDNPAAIRAMFRFAHDFQPDIWVLGGDQLNCGPISHWNRGTPRLVEGFRLKDEFDSFEYNILTPIEKILPKKNGRRIWHTGNHEMWIHKFIEQNPALSGIIDAESYLKLEQRKWEVYSQGEVSQVGKCYILHGDILGTSKGVAQRTVNNHRRSMRFGHFHGYDLATAASPLDNKDIHTAASVPCLALRGPSYGKNAPNSHSNGFIYGYVQDDGTFFDTIVLMIDNCFWANGKFYDGNKV